MIRSNLEQEETWLNAWDDLNVLILKNPDCHLLIPEYVEVSLDEAQAWVQEAAYESNRIKLKIEFYKGKKSIFIDKEAAS